MFLENSSKPHFLKVEVGRSAQHCVDAPTRKLLPTVCTGAVTARRLNCQRLVIAPTADRTSSDRNDTHRAQSRRRVGVTVESECEASTEAELRAQGGSCALTAFLFFCPTHPWRRTDRATSARGRAFKSTPLRSLHHNTRPLCCSCRELTLIWLIRQEYVVEIVVWYFY